VEEEEEEPDCPVRLARSLKSSFPCPLPAAPSPTPHTPGRPSAHNSQGWIQKRKHVATKAARVGLHRYRIRIRAVSVPDGGLYARGHARRKRTGVYILPTGRGRPGVSPSIRDPGRVGHDVSGARHALLPLPPAPMHPVSVRRGPGSGRIWPLPGVLARGRPRPRADREDHRAPGASAVGELDRGAGGGRAMCQCDAATGQDDPSPGLTPECYWTLPGFYLHVRSGRPRDDSSKLLALLTWYVRTSSVARWDEYDLILSPDRTTQRARSWSKR